MIETTHPVEVGRSVVDVDCKSHTNTANEYNGLPDWWYKDKTLENKTLQKTQIGIYNFQIVSSKDSSKKKSYPTN